MTQDEAKQLILDDWRALPTEERRTTQQAAMFAMRIKDKYRFEFPGDQYQLIKGWVQSSLRTWPD
jgi:hypothetical protein